VQLFNRDVPLRKRVEGELVFENIFVSSNIIFEIWVRVAEHTTWNMFNDFTRSKELT
jgi:hypothetical protein